MVSLGSSPLSFEIVVWHCQINRLGLDLVWSRIVRLLFPLSSGGHRISFFQISLGNPAWQQQSVPPQYPPIFGAVDSAVSFSSAASVDQQTPAASSPVVKTDTDAILQEALLDDATLPPLHHATGIHNRGSFGLRLFTCTCRYII